MQAEWLALQQALTGHSWAQANVKDLYFRRLLQVLADSSAGTADLAKACQDALRCARTHHIANPWIPLPEGAIPTSILVKAGLKRDSLFGGVVLRDPDMDPNLQDTYQSKPCRTLAPAAFDPALAAAMRNNGFQHYNGQGQQAAVRAALQSPEDATLFVQLPTGCGKTLVVHALMTHSGANSLTLVIVPTVALALEQADRAKDVLVQAGLAHAGTYAWYGGQKDCERFAIRERIRTGGQRILFCSPESALYALLPALFRAARNKTLGTLVIDEAHLVDQWGAGFRPEFQMLPALFRALRLASPTGVRQLFLSATYSPTTLQSLKELFAEESKTPIEVHGSFLRPEPDYHLVRSATEEAWRADVMRASWNLPRPMILYVTTKAEAIVWQQTLRDEDFKRAGLFFGDTPTHERSTLLEQWNAGELDLMVATSAFGVGMDRTDVRTVLHSAVPENLDRYFQEAGRGGRDGKACQAWLIYHPQQLNDARRINEEKLIGIDRGFERWQQMLHNHQPVEPMVVRVNLAARVVGLDYDSGENRRWNQRTLLLMQRAGMVRLRFQEPPAAFEQESELQKGEESTRFAPFFDQVEVELIHSGHANQAAWKRSVGTRRDQEKQDRGRGFQALKEWLDHPETPLCQAFRDYYTVEGIAPEPACGGCPGCRAAGKTARRPTLGSIYTSKGWPALVPSDVLPPSGLLRVPFEAGELQEGVGPLPLARWRDWISGLLRNRLVMAIRARREVLDALGSLLPQGAGQFWCGLELGQEPLETLPGRIPWPELVLLQRGDEGYLPPCDPRGKTRIVVAPDDFRDSEVPDRKRTWWAADPKALPLGEFTRRLERVHHQ